MIIILSNERFTLMHPWFDSSLCVHLKLDVRRRNKSDIERELEIRATITKHLSLGHRS